jgi:hypothetical protein
MVKKGSIKRLINTTKIIIKGATICVNINREIELICNLQALTQRDHLYLFLVNLAADALEYTLFKLNKRVLRGLCHICSRESSHVSNMMMMILFF